MRQLLSDTSERLEILECSFAALGVARPEAWNHELLDEACLPT